MPEGLEALLPPVRERAWWRQVVWVVASLSFVLGLAAFLLDSKATFVESLYLSVQLLILHMPHDYPPCTSQGVFLLFQAAKSFAVMAWATLGVLIVTSLFSKHQRLWSTVRKGDHTVICGLSGVGLELAEDAVRREGERVVVIDREPNAAATIRAEEAGASFIPGRPSEPQLLIKAGVQGAALLLAATEDDGGNIAAVLEARKAAPGKSLRPFVHIADPQLRALLRRQRTFSSDGSAPATIFNVFDNSARLLLRDYPLDHARIRSESKQVVQLVVIGFGHMGEAVLTRAALTGHYANLKRLQAIVIDRDAERKGRLFWNRYPTFGQVAGAQFLQADAAEPKTQAQIASLCAVSANAISTIVIAFDDPLRALSIALSLLNVMPSSVPIRLRLNDDSGLAALLPSIQVTPFGSMRDACRRKSWLDPELDATARKFHEYYLAKLTEAERSLENRTSREWDLLDDDFVDSNRQLADHIYVKLRAVGCYTTAVGSQDDPGEPVDHFEKHEIELLAKMEHRRWMAERFMAGWTPGPKRDVEKRQSPYLVEWEDLPPDIQERDRGIVRIIPNVLKLKSEIRR
jgi:voltage-gated potassium channel Kch